MSERVVAPRRHAKSERTLLMVGAGATLLGVAMSVGQSTLVSSLLTLGGISATVLGVHRFGRSGPDAPSPLDQRARGPRRRRASARSGSE